VFFLGICGFGRVPFSSGYPAKQPLHSLRPTQLATAILCDGVDRKLEAYATEATGYFSNDAKRVAVLAVGLLDESRRLPAVWKVEG
jgi:hypothetical protein